MSLSVFLSSSPPLGKTPPKSSDQSRFPTLKNTQILKKVAPFSLNKSQLSVIAAELFLSPPCLASESYISSTESASGKIDLDYIVASVDDFFNRNPFFVAGCTFIWVVVIPIVKFYLSKCKPISVIDAFGKLSNESNAQLLDIRDEKTLSSFPSPNLTLLDKNTVWVQFREDDELGFIKKVKERFLNPENTVVCVLDNFDVNSLKVAELLFKNGFSEAYAIRGGVRGKKGWLAIQGNLLPSSVHISSKKNAKTPRKLGAKGAVNQQVYNKLEVNDGSSLQSQVRDEQADDIMDVKIDPRRS